MKNRVADIVQSGSERLSRIAARRNPGIGELIADGIVHGVGIGFSLAAGIVLLVFSAFHTTLAEYAALAFYVGALLAVFGISCAYNLWPDSRIKPILRRADHAAIYLLIAGTYTPFLTQLSNSVLSVGLIVFIWTATAIGMAVKILLPGRFDRLAVGFYLAIGWSGILVFEPLTQAISTAAIVLMLAGGVAYSAGVIFFAWRNLRFQTAVWHGFVVTGAALHFAAIADTMLLERLA